MIASPPLAWILTAAFVLTGGYALLRCAATVSGGLPPERRTAELAHLVMSVSMVVMTWSWFSTAGLVVQVLLFTLFTLYFVVRAVRSRHGAAPGCAGGAAHALMAGAMVWMLVSMPLIMAAPVSAGTAEGGHAGHAGHEGHGVGTDHAMSSAGPAGWAVAVTLVLTVALLVACGYWALRALRRAPQSVPSTVRDQALVRDREPVREPALVGAGAPVGPIAAPATRPVPRGLDERADAACHTVMSLGMALMFAAMVAGW